jgi:hypothetical protein
MRSVIRIFTVFAFIVIFAPNILAEDAWYTCKITRIGGSTSDTGAIYVRLTDIKGKFSDLSFKIQEDRINQILAILLTAASNGSTVYIKADKSAKTLSAVHHNVE